MPAAIHGNPAIASESKSARKKKANAEAVTAATAATAGTARTAGSATPDGERAASIAGLDYGKSESMGVQYLRELQKQQRNLSKKLAATQRVDTIISENPGKSLDELVAYKLINLDQKAQAERKPHLQSQLETVDGQIAQFKKIEASYHGIFTQEKEEIMASHGKEKEEIRKQVQACIKSEMETQFRDRLLLISQFLKAAATRRNKEDAEASDPDGRAFEGVLSTVYYGDASAVGAFEKLLSGSPDKVTDWQGEVDVTYARVKQLTLQEAAGDEPLDEIIPADTREATAGATSAREQVTDRTVANAGLTEVTSSSPLKNGNDTGGSEDDHSNVPPSGTIGAVAGNAAAEELWDTTAPGDSVSGLEDSFEVIPRPADEVEVKETSMPAAITSTNSWADEAEASSAGLNGVAVNGGGNDFREVHHHRGRGRGGFRSEGHGRGRGVGGGRGDFRGRGRGGRGGDSRGEFRGRGRGGRGGRTD